MKKKFIIPFLILTISTFFISCETESNSSDEEDNSKISNSALSGFLNSLAFSPATTHFEKGELFGDAGYDIKLFTETKECDEFQSNADISFFIESEADLTSGEYDAKGPYFHYKDGSDSGSVSFFGAEVIIEEVTGTTIKGRVKGGKNDGVHYIEGAFIATLCQK